MRPAVCVRGGGVGVVASVNAALDKAGRADVLVLALGIEVGDEGISKLAAAAADSVVATASAVVGNAVDDHETPAFVYVPAPNTACVLVRRAAIDLAGELDESLGWEAALAAFATRCTDRGLLHVMVAGVGAPGRMGQLGELEARPAIPAARLLRAAASERPLSVTIDGRALGGTAFTGIQMHVLELIAALGRTKAVDLRVVTPPDPQPLAVEMLAASGAEQLPYEEAANGDPPRTDIVHRPQQVFTIDDLNLLIPLGHRVVVTYQDAILYGNPSYFPDVARWLDYRRVTRLSLGVADSVVFLSDHVRGQALAEELVEARRAGVVPNGVDHPATGAVAAEAPAGMDANLAARSLLWLGTNLRHKNRPFALRLVRELRERHGWDGGLIVAGPRAERGSSADEEEGLGGPWVHELGVVSEGERRWLLDHCAAVVYPTVVEGFGLVPFEAGLAGVPCLFAPQAALAEELPGLDTLVPWDAETSAAGAIALLRDEEQRVAHVAGLRAAAERFRWDAAAAGLLALYRAAVEGPATSGGLIAHDAVEREAALAGAQAAHQQAVEDHDRWVEAYKEAAAKYEDAAAQLADAGADGLRLVSARHGTLPADVQRALLALTTRRLLRRSLFALLRALYRLGRIRPGRT